MTREHLVITIGWFLAAIATAAIVLEQPDVVAALTLAMAAWVGGVLTYALFLVVGKIL